MFQESQAEWMKLQSKIEIQINETQLPDRKHLETNDQYGMPPHQWAQAVQWIDKNEKIANQILKERRVN